jgi:two-component system response regulator FixJ
LPDTFPVYVVDDDPSVRDWATLICEDLELSCRTFPGGREFLGALGSLEPGCILLDMRMPTPNGLAVQAELAESDRPMPVIAMTGYGDVEVAVQSMRLGAIEFLEKPIKQRVLAEALVRGFEALRQPSAS